ncbi:MAG: TIM barrel protein [Planctomycetia bacterium]|nr:TIM barrel protein [Planctomycetia bacterium]
MKLSRRDFLQTAALTVASASVISHVRTTSAVPATAFITGRPKKAILGALPDAARIEKLRALGIEGMEITGAPSIQEAEKMRKVAESMDFRFHSIMGGGSVERMELASALGADAVLVVPGRVSGVKMPEPWEFKIHFDEKTNRLLEVVEGDNTPYADYIKAHNAEMERARKHVESLIPTAEKLGIVIGLENVWNNMWVHPHFAANFVLSFDSPWVQAYFDIGNNVKYYPRPQDWFDSFQGKVIRVHIKDFKLNENGRGGRFARIMEGSVDWLAVRKKMEEVGFDRWMTVELEGCPLTDEEQAHRLELIASGKPLV